MSEEGKGPARALAGLLVHELRTKRNMPDQVDAVFEFMLEIYQRGLDDAGTTKAARARVVKSGGVYVNRGQLFVDTDSMGVVALDLAQIEGKPAPFVALGEGQVTIELYDMPDDEEAMT